MNMMPIISYQKDSWVANDEIKKFKVNFGIDALDGKNCPKRMFLNLDVIISLLLLVSLCSILGYKMWIKYT